MTIQNSFSSLLSETLIYSVRPELVEGQSPYFQGLRQAQPERFQINQRFLSSEG
jgi:hypothetical protein